MDLITYLNSSFNNKKLKYSRKKRKLSIEEVSDKTGIPVTTLQKYESGAIKKIPLDALKKICKLYGTDYEYYYGWTAFPLFGTFSGITLSYITGMSLNTLATNISAGFLIGVFGLKIAKKYFESKNKKDIIIQLYETLSEEEKKEYEKLKTIVNTFLGSKEIFEPSELKKEEMYLFSYFFAHKLKKEAINNNLLTPYDIENAEIIINDK